MHEANMREALEVLRRKVDRHGVTVTDAQWDWLCTKSPLLLDGIPTSADEVRDLVQEVRGYVEDAREVVAVWGNENPSNTVPSEDGRSVARSLPLTAEGTACIGAEELLGPEVNLRAEVFSLIVAHVAGGDQDVLKFRREYLRTEALSPDQAMDFLLSTALQFFSRSQLEQWGVPLVGHQAHLRLRIRGSADAEDGMGSGYRVFIDPPGTIFVTPEAFPMKNYWRRVEAFTINVQTGSGKRHQICVAPGSVLDDLRKLARSLGKRYPWTELEEIIRFVLTGEPPRVRLIAGNLLWYDRDPVPYGTIRLEIFPSVPAKAIARIYERIQQQVKGKARKGRVHDQSLRILRFVLQRQPGLISNPHDARPRAKRRWREWEVLLKEWNRDHPDSGNYGTVEGFYLACKRAYEQVLNDRLHLPYEPHPLRPLRKRGTTYDLQLHDLEDEE